MNLSNGTTLLILVIATVVSLIAYRWPQSRVARWWHAWARSSRPSRLTPQQRARWDGWLVGIFGFLSIAMGLQIAILERADLRDPLRPVQWVALGLAAICLVVGVIHSLRTEA